MKRFGYGADPLCVIACACYAINRWFVPTAIKGTFLRGYFADTLLIPAALPLMLWLQRRLGLRHGDAPPRWPEIISHVVIWAVAAEIVAPHIFTRPTGDPWDAVAYASGALVSGWLWQLA